MPSEQHSASSLFKALPVAGGLFAEKSKIFLAKNRVDKRNMEI